MAKFEEWKYLYYKIIYQQSYSDDHTFRRHQKQGKPIYIPKMLASHYHPTLNKPSPSSHTERDVLEIHASIFDPQRTHRCQFQKNQFHPSPRHPILASKPNHMKQEDTNKLSDLNIRILLIHPTIPILNYPISK